MRGVLQGMRLTLSHLGRPKVTRMYPYEKPHLPARSRELIQLIQEVGQETPFNLKCESCLLCEKICPPRCITIDYRPTNRFRKRPYFSERAKAGYYTPRISEYATDYAHRPISPVLRTPTKTHLEDPVDLNVVDRILARAPREIYTITELLDEVMQAYDGLPLAVAQRIVQARGLDLSDIFGIATMSPHFKPAPAKVPNVLRDDEPSSGPSAGTRGKIGNINHPRGASWYPGSGGTPVLAISRQTEDEGQVHT
jgi:ferredoxin